MDTAFAPDFARPNELPPSRNASAAMPDAAATAEKVPEFSDARARIEEIEQLYIVGLTTYQIAEALGLRPRDVGRNLRETRKRMQRAARRQTEILAVGQCAAIHREAMEGWRRSQESKVAITTRRKSGEPDTVTTRTENRPGSASFLNTALRAVKQLREIAGEMPAAPRKASDAVRLAILDVLTPEQFATLDSGQLQRFRTSLDRWRDLMNAVDDGLHEADASPQEPPAAEPPIQTQAAPVAGADKAALDAQPAQPEAQVAATADAGASDDAAKDDQTVCAERPCRQPPARPASTQPRHPEWPAESFLTRSWLPPGHDFAVNRGENAAHPIETIHERNGCAPEWTSPGGTPVISQGR
jgi:hypothetical protein